MESLFNRLSNLDLTSESILDVGDIVAQGEKAITDAWLKSCARGNYKLKRLKTGRYKVTGDLIFRNYTGTSFNQGFTIETIIGNLYIENCPNLENIEGLFEYDETAKEYGGTVQGNLYIENCPNFSSLRGIPRQIDGKLSVSQCRSLRDISGVTVLASEIILMKCGRKFRQEQIQAMAPAATRIYCSADDNDDQPLIVESFQDPILTMVYYQAQSEHLKFKFRRFLGNYAFDKIPSYVASEYDMTDPKQKKAGLKAARAVLSWSGAGRGFVITYADDYFQGIFTTGGRYVDCYWLTKKWNSLQGGSSMSNQYNQYGITETIQYMSEIPSKLYVYDFNNKDKVDSGEYDIWKLRDARSKSREGMIDRSPEGYERILRDQRARYKKLIAQMKAQKKSAKYIAVADRVNAMLARVQKLTTKMLTDTVWAYENRFDIGDVMDTTMIGSNSIVATFKYYSDVYVRVSSGNNMFGTTSTEKLDDWVNGLDRRLDSADELLKQLGV